MNFQSQMFCLGLGYLQMILANNDQPGQSWDDKHRKDGRAAILPNNWNCMDPVAVSCEGGLATATGTGPCNLVKVK